MGHIFKILIFLRHFSILTVPVNLGPKYIKSNSGFWIWENFWMHIVWLVIYLNYGLESIIVNCNVMFVVCILIRSLSFYVQLFLVCGEVEFQLLVWLHCQRSNRNPWIVTFICLQNSSEEKKIAGEIVASRSQMSNYNSDLFLPLTVKIFFQFSKYDRIYKECVRTLLLQTTDSWSRDQFS